MQVHLLIPWLFWFCGLLGHAGSEYAERFEFFAYSVSGEVGNAVVPPFGIGPNELFYEVNETSAEAYSTKVWIGHAVFASELIL